MTTPCSPSDELSTTLRAVAGLLADATDLGHDEGEARVRVERRRPLDLPLSRPTSHASADGVRRLGALLRTAAESHAAFERRAREVLGPQRSLAAAVPSLLAFGGLRGALPSADVPAVVSLGSAIGQISTAISGVLRPRCVQLRAKLDGGIRLEESSRSTSGVQWTLRSPVDGAPDVYQWLRFPPFDGPVAIRLTWSGLEKVSVSSGGVEWGREELLDPQTAKVAGYAFESSPRFPLANRVSITMQLRVDEPHQTHDRDCDIRADTGASPAADDEGPIVAPTLITTQVPGPTPNWIPGDLIASGVDPRQAQVLAQELVEWVVRMVQEVKEIAAGRSVAIDRDHALLLGVTQLLGRTRA